MKKVKPLLFVGAMIMIASYVYGENSVSFINVKGKVSVKPDIAEDTAYKSASSKKVFSAGERVKTSEKSIALLNYLDSGSIAVKPDTEAVFIYKIEKKGKLNLVFGDMWFSLKEDAEMTVEMSQSIVDFKGAVVTFSVSQNGLDNNIKVLKGEATVTIKGSKEVKKLYGGQGMNLKQNFTSAMQNKPAKGVIDYIDSVKEEKIWEEEISRVADHLSTDELTKQINKYCDNLDSAGKAILARYELIVAGSGTKSDISSLKNRISAFNVLLTEARQYYINAKRRIGSEDKSRDNVKIAGSYAKASLETSIKRFDSIKEYFDEKLREVDFSLKAKEEPDKFKQKSLENITSIEEKLEKAYLVSDKIRKAYQNNIDRKSQRWFVSACETLARCGEELEKVSKDIAKERISYPKDKNLPDLAKRAEQYIQEMEDLTKELTITEIEPAVVTNLYDLKDDIAYVTGVLVTAIEEYRATSGTTVASRQKKRKALEKVLNSFNSIQRNYRRAERQCNNIFRKCQSSKYETTELHEVKTIWREIQDEFIRLDEESGTLRRIINE